MKLFGRLLIRSTVIGLTGWACGIALIISFSAYTKDSGIFCIWAGLCMAYLSLFLEVKK